jgi:sarcosine oxidase subunit alpha
MPDKISISINGQKFSVGSGTSVAVALMIHGHPTPRRSTTGQPRGPLCGMGICFECRATINGQSQLRTCQTLCHEGMEISTDDL